MRQVKIKESNEHDGWATVDWKDIGGVFSEMDELLKPFGLELVMGENYDDTYWFKIERLKKKKRR